MMKYSQSLILKAISLIIFIFFISICIQYVKDFKISIFSIFVLVSGVGLVVWSMLLVYDCFSYIEITKFHILIKKIIFQYKIDIYKIEKYQFIKTNLFCNFSQGYILVIWSNTKKISINIYNNRFIIEKLINTKNIHLTTAST
jgi:hypothetical protein